MWGNEREIDWLVGINTKFSRQVAELMETISHGEKEVRR